MKVALWATSIGDERFGKTLMRSHYKNTFLALPDDITHRFRFILDTKVKGVDQSAFISEFSYLTVMDDRDKGVNAIWGRCVYESAACDLCVVMNDDVWLTPGWLYAVTDIMKRNPCLGIVGISCDDRALEQRMPDYRERWFSLNGELHDDFAAHRDMPVDYEPWTSGILWAVRPLAFLSVGGIDPGLWLSYGEMDMARKLWKAGWSCASIYYPLVFHYGGGSRLQHDKEGFCARVDEHAHNDCYRFEELYGSGHSHLLMPVWKEEVMASELPELQYDPTPVERLYAGR